MTHRSIIGPTIALALLASGALRPAFADDAKNQTSASHKPRGTFTFVLENDYFARRDQDYTNGLRISYVTAPYNANGLEKRLAALIAGDSPSKFRRGYAFGQEIFTPKDKDATAPLPDQHPYGAHLYGEYSAVVEHDDGADLLTVQLGVVGPWAQGERVQNWYHELNGFPRANGWANQIKNEPAIGLSYDKLLRPLWQIDKGPIHAGLRPTFGASLGTTHINGRAGVLARIVWIGVQKEPRYGGDRRLKGTPISMV